MDRALTSRRETTDGARLADDGSPTSFEDTPTDPTGTRSGLDNRSRPVTTRRHFTGSRPRLPFAPSLRSTVELNRSVVELKRLRSTRDRSDVTRDPLQRDARRSPM